MEPPLIKRPNKVTCPRCNKPATHVVKTYWESVYGSLCPACCKKAVKHYDKEGWPDLPEGWEVPEIEMPQPQPVLDAPAAQEAKLEAMERVDTNADPSWKEKAYDIIVRVAERLPEFTPDDIWEAGLPMPMDGRALGPVMKRIASRKIASKTDRVVPTRQVKSHGTDVAVWKSLIYGRN